MIAKALAIVLLLVAACRINVPIWIDGHQVARPPIAGLILLALAAVIAAVFYAAFRQLRGFRSSPCIRTI